MTTHYECYVCLENINLNQNDFIELNCCKQNVHFNCLKQWYIKNKTPNCFICNQTTETSTDFLNNYIQIQQIQQYPQIQQTQQIQPYQQTQQTQQIQPYPQTQQIPIIYTKNKLAALLLCYFVNFLILINLVIILYN